MNKFIIYIFFAIASVNLSVAQTSDEQKEDWKYRLLEFSQLLNEADEEQEWDINLQIIELLYPIYTNYDKRNRKDNAHINLCVNLIKSFVSTKQFKQAETVLKRASKHVRKDNLLLFTKVKIEEVSIAVAKEEYDGAKLLLESIRPNVDVFLDQNYLQSCTTFREITDALSAVINYDNVSSEIRLYYINKISSYLTNQLWEEALQLQEQEKNLFLFSLLTNEKRSLVNENGSVLANLFEEKLGISLDFNLDKRTTDVDCKVHHYLILGICHMNLGNIQEADKHIHLAELAMSENDLVSASTMAFSYFNSAQFYKSVNNIGRAIFYFNKCFGICSRYDDDNIQIICRRALAKSAVLDAENGFIKKAQSTTYYLLKYYLDNNLAETIDFIDLLIITEQIASLDKDFEEVCALCELAIEHIPRVEAITNKQTYLAIFYNALANAQCELRQYETAQKTLDNLGKDNYTSNSYYTLAKIQHKQEKFSEAINSLKLCLKYQSKNESYSNKLDLFLALLTTSVEANQEIDIDAISNLFLSIFETLVTITIGDDREKSIPIYQIYHGAFLYYCRHFDTNMNAAYNLSLLMKGAMLQSDIDFKDRVYATNDNELIKKLEHLDELKHKRNNANKEMEFELINEEIYYKEKIIMSELTFYASKENRISWIEIQNELSDNDIAVEFVDYIISENSAEYAALVLKKDWPAPKMVPLFEKKQFDKLIPTGVKEDVKAERIYSGFAGKQISNLIWQPLSEYLSENDNIYFSPSGVLHQLAIESLPLEDGRLASEKYNLYRLSSTKQLCYERPEKKYNKAVLYGGLKYDLENEIMVAQSRAYTENRDHYSMRGFESDTVYRGSWGYLNGSKKEVENISSTLEKNGTKAVVFKEENGNEESFHTLSGEKYDIIHIATHGFFLPLQEARKKEYFTMMGDNSPVVDNSMNRSGLILSGGNKAWRGESIPDEVEDGVLTAQEITTLDLRGADLVVLSACETGLGEVSGEGVFGLQRAFKKAGAQTLIMTLWKVSDEATQFMMSKFYSHLLSGNSKREAFLKAQAATKAKYTNPYYWAGFIMLD